MAAETEQSMMGSAILPNGQAAAEIDLDKRPMRQYGPGVANFLQFMVSMIELFAILSVLACIQMWLYKSLGGLEFLGDDMGDFVQHSFAMMGFAGTSCGEALLVR